MKRLPEITETMEREGMKLTKVLSGHYRAICPFCLSTGKRMVVYPDRQIFSCHECCGKGGDVVKFIMFLKRTSIQFAASYLSKAFRMP